MQTAERRGEFVFLLLVGLFVAALVSCNLIANKFVSIDMSWLGFTKPLVVSAGILPYPVTFLVTDILSEVYGKRRANQVVVSGFVASIFVLGVLWLGGQFLAIDDSPIGDEDYAKVFQNAWRVIGASMIAYICAQLVDVQLFHFWKRVTKGRHLWLRNNASTIASQLLDTALVVCVIFVGVWPAERIVDAVIDGWLFKSLCALADTPIIYGLLYLFRRFGVVPAVDNHS